MAALETLLRAVMARWSISPSGMIAHSDMAPGRKSDPGARFDWRRLAHAGLSVWPDAPGDPTRPLSDSLDAAIGYPPAEAPLTCLWPSACVFAHRRAAPKPPRTARRRTRWRACLRFQFAENILGRGRDFP